MFLLLFLPCYATMLEEAGLCSVWLVGNGRIARESWRACKALLRSAVFSYFVRTSSLISVWKRITPRC